MDVRADTKDNGVLVELSLRDLLTIYRGALLAEKAVAYRLMFGEGDPGIFYGNLELGKVRD